MYKATFAYSKLRERFSVQGSNEHSTQVLMPGIDVDEVQVTGPKPFKIEIRNLNGGADMPQIIESKQAK